MSSSSLNGICLLVPATGHHASRKHTQPLRLSEALHDAEGARGNRVKAFRIGRAEGYPQIGILEVQRKLGSMEIVWLGVPRTRAAGPHQASGEEGQRRRLHRGNKTCLRGALQKKQALPFRDGCRVSVFTSMVDLDVMLYVSL